MELTPKQQAFVNNYADPNSDTRGNATRSYIKAGYKDSRASMVSACQLLSNPKIKQAIDGYRAGIEHKSEVKAEYIREQWLALLDDCKQDGHYIDRKNANAVLRTMAQSCGMLIEKVQTEAITQPDMSEAERELYDQAARELKLKLSRTA
jgi:phage terminase small subunit